jgi:hypothetical protein
MFHASLTWKQISSGSSPAVSAAPLALVAEEEDEPTLCERTSDAPGAEPFISPLSSMSSFNSDRPRLP